MSKRYFVTGIGTGIGKTLISTILTEKLKADYWKPVQSGDLMQSDSMFVENHITNKNTKIYPEQYRLNYPVSPHLSARMDGIEIKLEQFECPQTKNNLIIEGAGGLLVPLNDRYLIIDLIKQLEIEAIVVSQNYLGSINHTLLTLTVLKQYQIPVKGVIFNGETNAESEDYILKYTQTTCLGRIPVLHPINKNSIIEAGKNLIL